MRELIESIVKAEEEAGKTVAEAERKASELLAAGDAELSEQLNIYREKQHQRLTRALAEAEAEGRRRIEEARQTPLEGFDNTDSIAEKVLDRILRTVFDK